MTKPMHTDLADLTIATSSPGANVYVARWPKHWGWAIVIIDDRTGTLAITSDHGNWAFTWGTKHIGAPTLHHFLLRTDAEYVATKCIPSNRARVASHEKTKKGLLEHVLETRRRGELSKKEARARYDEILDWPDEGDGDNCYAWTWPSWCEAMGATYEWIREEPTGEWTSFCEIVWPVVQRCIREELERRERPPAEHQRFGAAS